MKSNRIRCALMLAAMSMSNLASAQSPPSAPQQRPGEVRSFELHPVGPPTPALRYALLFDIVDRYQGNAALAYMQASMLIASDMDTLQDQSNDALTAANDARFRDLSRKLIASSNGVVDMLELAGRRDSCDWQPSLRERGVAALLPHLNKMRLAANILAVRAIAQARDGKPEDAVATLRLGYELTRNIGTEPVLVSGLVSIGIQRQMHEATVELMNSPTSPNLYWALASLPRPLVTLRRSMEGERVFLYGSIPSLLRARAGEELSTEEWRMVIRQLAQLSTQMSEPPTTAPAKSLDFVESAMLAAIAKPLPAAQEQYARLHKMTGEQMAKIDNLKVNAAYFFEQYCAFVDDQHKVLSMPYPQMLPLLRELDPRLKRQQEESPDNPFMELVPALERAAVTFARAERALAALTAVEAIRSFAAEHDGKLPDHLEDIEHTPAPINPWTGVPFEYHFDGDAAVLSDSHTTEQPLEYTIRIKR